VDDTLIHKFGTGGYPVYIRKLDKKSVWGHHSDDLEERVVTAVGGVFPAREPRYSFYLARSDEELKRIVVALNGFRLRPNDKIDFIAFTEDELATVEITIAKLPGNTECKAANHLHVDVHAGTHSNFSSLCQNAFSARRNTFRVSKKEAKAMWQELGV